MKVLVFPASAHNRFTFGDPPPYYYHEVYDRDTKNQERRGYFSARIDGEYAEHESVEHGTAVSHKNLCRWEIKQQSARCNSCEYKT